MNQSTGRKGVSDIDATERLRTALGLDGGSDEATNPTEAAWEWGERLYSARWTLDKVMGENELIMREKDVAYHHKPSDSQRFVLLALARCLEQGGIPTATNVGKLISRKTVATKLNLMSRGFSRKSEWGNGGMVGNGSGYPTDHRISIYTIGQDAPLKRKKIGRRFHYYLLEPD